MEVVSSAAGKIVEWLFNSAGRHLGYLFNYNDNIQTLKKQAKKLDDTRDRVQGEIIAAERKGEIVVAEVHSWIAEANNISAEAEKFLDEEVAATKSCLKGWCINLKQRYQFSKEANQRILGIHQLREDGKFQNVSRPAPPPEIISSYTGFSGIFESRKSIMEKIMEALNDDSAHIIGICGMGGVGKTTLVKEFGKQAKAAMLYGAVVMAVVTQSPSISKIQLEIAHMLGLENFPENAELAAASTLWERIKKEKRILVILDDIWGKIELDKIGIPFRNDHAGCKILLTSRSKSVCNQMDCDKIFSVGTLTEQECWVLFKEIAGPDVEKPDISSTARDIAAKCGGLPIAIVTVARALKNKNKHVWNNAARQLKMSLPKEIEGMQGYVISSLELSYNYLESEEAKSLFLFCCFFPEDSKIPVEVLVRYGMALRWFKDVDAIEDVRDRVHAIVSNLTSSFLLIDDNENVEFVKMHDVIRDFALMIAPKYNHVFMVKSGTGLREWPSRDSFEEFTGISLMSNDIHEVPDGLKCPNLRALLLQRSSKLLIPNNFFQEMKDLNVLDLSQSQLLSLPRSLLLLANLRTLYLNDCILGDLSIIGHLSNLEILSLCGSSIREIPISFSQLSHLRLLDLNKCQKLMLIPHYVIYCLRKLEELYMIKSFRHWDLEREGDLTSNSTLVELQVLPRLTSLQICIPDSEILPNHMSFQNLSSFTFEIGPKDAYWDTSRYSRRMMLSSMNISKIFGWVKNLLERTEELVLTKISGLENILQDLVKEGFNNLLSLTIESCEIKFLLNTLEWSQILTFQNIEKLKMYDNHNLVEICHGQPLAQSFTKLKTLNVSGCSSMLNIVPSHFLQRLQNLETFSIYDCESVVNVFDCEGLEIANGETKLILPLKEIELMSLPMMTHLFKGNDQLLSLCKLKVLDVHDCPKLMKLFSPALLHSLICLENICILGCGNLEDVFGKRNAEDEEKSIVPWKKHHTTISRSLGNLTSLSIRFCNKLQNLFTLSIVKSLVKLKTLSLSFCSRIQEIVTNEENENGASTNMIVFPSLYTMRLGVLDNLTCFSSGLYTIEFPALEELWISKCPKMKTFSYGDQLTPKLNKVLTFDLDGEQRELPCKGNLNTIVQQLFQEQEKEKIKEQNAKQPGGLPEGTSN